MKGIEALQVVQQHKVSLLSVKAALRFRTGDERKEKSTRIKKQVCVCVCVRRKERCVLKPQKI